MESSVIEKRAEHLARIVAKLAPGGTYSACWLDMRSAEQLAAWARDVGVPNVVDSASMHVTILHAEERGVDPDRYKPLRDGILMLNTDYVGKLGDRGQAAVLHVHDPRLTAQYVASLESGAVPTTNWGGYKPHITLSYDAEGWHPVFQRTPPFAIRLEPEIVGRADGSVARDSVSIVKVDDDKRMVFGIFSLATKGGRLAVDLQDDVIESEEMEKMAYGFVLEARVAGREHEVVGVGDLVESAALTVEKQQAIVKVLRSRGINAVMDLGCEVWWGGFKISDERVWKAVKAGEFTGFSIGGTARRDSVG